MKFTVEDGDRTYRPRWSPEFFQASRAAARVYSSVAVGTALLLTAGCSGTPQPAVLSPQTMTSAPADDVALTEPEPETAASAAVDPTAPVRIEPTRPGDEKAVPDPTMIVVAGSLKPQAAGDDRTRLRVASHREKERRARAQQPVAVITDENLSEMAAGARVTMGRAPEVDAETKQAMELAEELKEQEIYWRTRAREVRQEWREAYDSIQDLEKTAEELRTKFYAADDPVRRDREVKPAWDRALDRLDEARRSVDRSKEKLATLQDEGRRSGALPGWLREGAELQPPELVDDEISEANPAEPKIIKNY